MVVMVEAFSDITSNEKNKFIGLTRKTG